MAYLLRALIGSQATVAQAAVELGAETVALPQGFALLPLPLAESDAPLAESESGDPCLYLTDVVSAAAAAASIGGGIAYVEAELYGGVGTQTAVTWIDGDVLETHISCFGSGRDPGAAETWAINGALRRLGVTVGDVDQVDQFEALDLGRHRTTEAWRDGTSA